MNIKTIAVLGVTLGWIQAAAADSVERDGAEMRMPGYRHSAPAYGASGLTQAEHYRMQQRDNYFGLPQWFRSPLANENVSAPVTQHNSGWRVPQSDQARDNQGN